MEEFKEILQELKLIELYNYLQKKKVIDIDTIKDDLNYYSRDEILLDIGQLLALGSVMVKIGNPLKVVCLYEEDAEDRYKRRFG